MSAAAGSGQGGPSVDLSEIITHVARSEMATDEVTIAFLDAGETLLHRYFLGTAPEPGAAESLYSRILLWVSRPAVSKEAQRRADAAGRKATESAFRHRWHEQMHYVRDLLAYVMRDQAWREHVADSIAASQEILDNRPLDEAIEQIAYQAPWRSRSESTYRIQTVFQTIAPTDEQTARMMREIYALSVQSWTNFYRDAFDSFGLRLRPDVTFEDFANALNIAADGVMLRMLVGKNPAIVDDANQRSILGLIAMALVAACTDLGDGMPLRDAIRQVGQLGAQQDHATETSDAAPANPQAHDSI